MAVGAEITIIEYGNLKKGVIDGVEKGLQKVAIKVVAQAKSLAPVDTARLRNSISYALADGFKGGANGDASPITVTPPNGSAYVGTNVDYAVYQEFGTRRMAPQPFLRPALDIVVNGADGLQAMAKAMNNSVKRETKSGKRTRTKKK